MTAKDKLAVFIAAIQGQCACNETATRKPESIAKKAAQIADASEEYFK